ncbi:amidohydrolase family protein [Dactylosporangium sp. CS-033363]|uniref:amidohydrolase family protein n=1 Tax=Dactylosporangium sp. CS-033363 TaxID=3239935 RepID=UPI003D8ACF20
MPDAIVDSYAHVGNQWYEPVETLLYVMDANDVERAVLLQYTGQFDNAYLLGCARKWPDRLAAVPAIDPASPGWRPVLDALVEQGARGIRLHPASRCATGDPLDIWRAAGERGLVISCLGTGEEFASAEFQQVLAATGGAPVIVEHMGSKRKLSQSYTVEDAQTVFAALLPHDNVLLQVHGLGENLPRRIPSADFPFTGTPDVLLAAAAAFPAGRLLWGSDFPSVLGREGYRNSFDQVRRVLHGADLDRIFAANARRLYFEGPR